MLTRDRGKSAIALSKNWGGEDGGRLQRLGIRPSIPVALKEMVPQLISRPDVQELHTVSTRGDGLARLSHPHLVG